MIAPKYFESFQSPAPETNLPAVRTHENIFYMRVNSNVLSEAGIKSGDTVIVDRNLEPSNGRIVIATVQGEMLIRQLEIREGKKRLLAAGTQKMAALEMDHEHSAIWGVVTGLIRAV